MRGRGVAGEAVLLESPSQAGAFARGHRHDGERRCPGQPRLGLRQTSEKEETGRRRLRVGAPNNAASSSLRKEGEGCLPELGLEMLGVR